MKKYEDNDYSAVIVEYFSGTHLFSCIDSLEAQTHKPKEIVVVVNGISEDAKAKLDTFANVSPIYPGANLGYARAANLGIAATRTNLVLVTNPDVVLDKECAQIACAKLAMDNDIGALGPKILEEDGGVYPSARNEPNVIDALGHGLLGIVWKNNPFTRRYKNLGADKFSERESDWLSGAIQFLKRKALDDIGGWDEDYFMYCEDIDLGARMRVHGYKNVYFPEAVAIHIQGVSTDRAPFSLIIQHHKSLLKFTNKRHSKNLLIRLATYVFVGIRLPVALTSRALRIQ